MANKPPESGDIWNRKILSIYEVSTFKQIARLFTGKSNIINNTASG